MQKSSNNLFIKYAQEILSACVLAGIIGVANMIFGIRDDVLELKSKVATIQTTFSQSSTLYASKEELGRNQVQVDTKLDSIAIRISKLEQAQAVNEALARKVQR